MALGSAGSDFVASENQAANSCKGSSASVKSPLVIPSGCFIEACSGIAEFQVVAEVTDRALLLCTNMRPVADFCPFAAGFFRLACRNLYRAGLARRLWRALSAAVLISGLAVTAGGCSFSYQLDNMFAKKDDPAATHSLQLTSPTIKPVDIVPPEADLAMARAAATEVMTKGGKDASLSWENPQTGTRGTVTPIASARNEDGGVTCHEFLASFEREGTSSWMQGDACRASKGQWEVRSLKPWQQRT
jgi:hypothetical protein